MRRLWWIGAIALAIACDAKVEPGKTEAKAEPAKVEPAKVEPAKVEPPVDPGKADAAKVEPAVEPAKVDEAKAAAAPVDPGKADEAKVEPAKVEPPVDPGKADEARVAADTKAPAEARPDRPKGSIPEQLRCSRDADCEFVGRPCTCEPCGEYWREVMNRTALQELKNRWAVRKCKQPTCPTCVSKRLGTKAVCVRGKCEAR